MPLLEPDVLKITPEPSDPSSDRAPEWVAGGTPEPLRSELIGLLGEDRVLARATDIIRYASDASPYRKLPKVVIMAHDAGDVSKVLKYGRENGINVTFRSGGTSLNGQGQTDGILVDTRRHFGGIEVLDGGKARFGRPRASCSVTSTRCSPPPATSSVPIPPRPTSPRSAESSPTTRAACAAASPTTRIRRSRRWSSSCLPAPWSIRPRPTPRRSSRPPNRNSPKGCSASARRSSTTPNSTARIRHKFEIKNTTGYRLCAFLDAETPVEIMRRLIVGSEGTLAFISRVTFETVKLPVRTTLAWLHFPDIPTATDPVKALVDAGASAVELMVAPALITAGWNMPGRAAVLQGHSIPTRPRCWSSSPVMTMRHLDAAEAKVASRSSTVTR